MRRLRPARVLPAAAIATGALLLLAGCGSQGGAPSRSGRLKVVAAENFWGSIARQLGGDRVSLRSIIVNPGTDPHEYEPTPSDARMIAESQMVIVNGIGYDEWASRLLAAEAGVSRTVLNVGDLLGLRLGANPHQWYSPSSVSRVIDAITADYQRLDPRDSAYFAARRHAFQSRGLARYHALIADIRRRYAGVPVGYSESIFEPLGKALHLRLATPAGFAKAVAEGTEVSAADRSTVDSQAREHRIAVWVLNSQNITPDVRLVNQIAISQRIPIATVTETLSPASDTFQQWQVSELEGLQRALHAATGR